ncbi:hypothetical protein HNP48_004887 [Acidovorax soli]|uniref:Lipoprotein n=1 Tax=Acidovorax soli TaxID=592050 RepID=A0A7X0PHS5_9BURK|nr:hypothetical protein [Acidovorax soli]MBB6562178.1 hypothetical protein [Acidovorax soli]
MRLWISAALVAALGTVGCGKQSESESASSAAQPLPAASAPAVPAPPSPPPPVAKVWEGPMGVKMGLSVDELRQAIKLEDTEQPRVFLSDTAPSPHDAFEVYTYIATPDAGLCKMSAIGKTIKTSVYGNELRNGYASLKAALTEKYGKPTSDFDRLRQGSIWDEPRDWMMALFKKERTLTAFWDAEPDKKGGRKITLPNELSIIRIFATAEGTEAGYITVSYAFTNEEACIAEIKKAKNKSL